MLHKATPAQTAALGSVVETIEEALFVLHELDSRTLPTERRMLYSAAYGLILIGGTIEQHCSQLELISPEYPWAGWVDLRNRLTGKPGQVSVDEIARAVTEDAPQLVRDITGAEPNVGPKVRLEDLPLDDIADFCREWGIKEAYMTPPELTGVYLSGPFEGVELALLVDYHDDAPGRKRHSSMGPFISQRIGIKTYVGGLPAPHNTTLRWPQTEMMAQKMPVYVE